MASVYRRAIRKDKNRSDNRGKLIRRRALAPLAMRLPRRTTIG
ncbi:hypothetical protein RSSM_02424 [Rhodopirellula sallentina SM41]|uniref:Uncharacterized protein n=1 Tax=Rhodopirellula sallentina SM41 TaxID=1263870 RepID=M5U486_9BACT|nr:hypothetical protein RSSM_02424 [Rhodopirellula sallentina SM41]